MARYCIMSSPTHLLKPDHLLSTAEQLTLINFYNEDCWREFSSEQLNNVPVDNEPQRDLSSLKVLHVDFGSPEATISGWRRAFMPRLAGFAHWNSYDDSIGSLDLRENTRTYQVGIHEVRLDLTANADTTSMVDIWQRTAEEGQVLAHGEVLSAMGLHRFLLEPRRDMLLPVLGGYALELGSREKTQSLQMDTDNRSWGLRYYSSVAALRSNTPVPLVLDGQRCSISSSS